MKEKNPVQNSTFEKEESGSIFAAVFNLIPAQGNTSWNLRVCVEGILISLFSCYVVIGINVPEAGLVGLSLASAAMVPRFNTILATNRGRIWAGSGSRVSANAQSTISGMSIFAGLFIGVLIMTLITDSEGIKEHFGFVVTQTGFEPGDSLSAERFATGSGVIIVHNLFVLFVFAILAASYRSLGTMIALGWNASVWAITLSLFIKGESSGTQFLHLVIVVAAVMPHLVVEAFGYVVGALSGIFLSRGVVLYKYSDQRFQSVLMAVLILAVSSVLLIIAGGLIETNYTPWVLNLEN